MLNVEHLLDNAVCELERHEVHEAYRQFMESPCNIELAENAGIRLDDVWVMAVYCTTTLRQDWKEKWEDEAEQRIPVVRCKDCKHRKTDRCAMYYDCYDCGTQCSWETDNDYCSMGERRDGGT